MSHREKTIREETQGNPSDTLVGMKGSIHAILTSACGIAAPMQACAFTLNTKEAGLYCIIFVASVHLDLSAHTIVSDAYVLSMTESLLDNPRIAPILSRFPAYRKRLSICMTLPTEVSGWKRLLPAFAERCRDWEHTDQCDYTVHGRVPLSVAVDKDPLCSCGRGKSVSTFLSFRSGGVLLPWSPGSLSRLSSLYLAWTGSCLQNRPLTVTLERTLSSDVRTAGDLGVPASCTAASARKFTTAPPLARTLIGRFIK